MSKITTPKKLPSPNVLNVLIVFKCLFFIVGILGNASVIIYNVFFNCSNSPTRYFVVNLAINDFNNNIWHLHSLLVDESQSYV